jgi:hypothetical protein
MIAKATAPYAFVREGHIDGHNADSISTNFPCSNEHLRERHSRIAFAAPVIRRGVANEILKRGRCADQSRPVTVGAHKRDAA